jgi:glycosyltransferase involved in cell wall biosynthesis
MSALTSVAHPESPAVAPDSSLKGKRVGVLLYSSYPADPRPRRAAEAMLKEGMSVDMICLQDGNEPARETHGSLDIIRVPLTHRRGNKVSYLYRYSAFVSISAAILAWRAIRRRYDLIYVNNMPDVLVASALVPKLLGAKVILDQHDPMPELMMTIFGLDQSSFGVRLLTRLEKWSISRADLVITVNEACKTIFGARSCHPGKIGVVMNSPDEAIFPFSTTRSSASSNDAPRGKLVMMYHGSLVERNGLDLAVEALTKLRTAIPNVELRIFGRETPFLQKVMTEVRTQGLGDNVTYLGPRSLEGLVTEIEACDVGVIPNHRNAFAEINTPTRIFEYLALGKPVIAPRAAGITAYFDECSMVFFELGNAEDLARKLEYVFGHPREIGETVRKGQAVYRDHCWQTERQRLVGLVAGLLSHSVRAAEFSTPTPQPAKTQ